MAQIVWSNPAFSDLDEIVEYISYADPEAAESVSQRILAHVRQLEKHPESGPNPEELEECDIRQLVEPPCRIFYSFDGETVYILHVLRFERLLRPGKLERDKS